MIAATQTLRRLREAHANQMTPAYGTAAATPRSSRPSTAKIVDARTMARISKKGRFAAWLIEFLASIEPSALPSRRTSAPSISSSVAELDTFFRFDRTARRV